MTSQWPDTEEGTEVVVLCPTCESGEIAYDELVPRSLGMNVVRRKDGKLAAEPDGLKYDECAWEGSMQERPICMTPGRLRGPWTAPLVASPSRATRWRRRASDTGPTWPSASHVART